MAQTLQFSDGFDSYAATADLSRRWSLVTSPWAWGGAVGKNGGGGISCATTGGAYMRANVGGLNESLAWASGTGGCIGFWFKASGAPNALSVLLRCMIAENPYHNIRVTTGGLLAFYDLNTLRTTGVTIVCDGLWHWIEAAMFTNSGSTNQYLYIDGAAEWTSSVSVAASGGSTLEFVEFGSLANVTTYIDDVVLGSVTTASLASSFPMGPKVITTIRPDGDDSTQFTRSTGSDSYALIDETNNASADYVQANTSGYQDLYTYSALGSTPASIMAVAPVANVVNPNAGTVNHQQVCKSSSTTSAGTSRLTSPSIHSMQDFFQLDPNGNIAWTTAAVDAAKLGIKVV